MLASRKRETAGWEGLEVLAVVECLRAEAFDFLSELLWMFPSISLIGKDCRATLLQVCQGVQTRRLHEKDVSLEENKAYEYR